MTLDELAKKFSETILNAPHLERITMAILFGIKYCDFINQVGATNVVKESGINKEYYGEIRRGVNLAKYIKY